MGLDILYNGITNFKNQPKIRITQGKINEVPFVKLSSDFTPTFLRKVVMSYNPIAWTNVISGMSGNDGIKNQYQNLYNTKPQASVPYNTEPKIIPMITSIPTIASIILK